METSKFVGALFDIIFGSNQFILRKTFHCFRWGAAPTTSTANGAQVGQARIKMTGSIWKYGLWAFSCRPLVG